MLRFKVIQGGAAREPDLDGAHLSNGESQAVRAEFKYARGELLCEPKSPSAAALSINWPLPEIGPVMVETPRLLERAQPYNLAVELARGHLMRVSLKREDWGLYDYPDGADVFDQVIAAREKLLEAISASDEAKSAALGEEALAAVVKAGEAVGRLNAEIHLQKRREAGLFPHRPLGCRLELTECARIGGGPPSVTNQYAIRLKQAFDFVWIPFSWRQMEPQHGKHATAEFETLVKAFHESKLPVWAASVLSFDPRYMPPWLPGYARSVDKLRDAVTTHLKHVLRAIGAQVRAWEVVSGLNAHNPLRLTYEQILEFTRMSTALVKRASPRSQVLVGISLPWGEYYAKDAQTIQPLMYADAIAQTASIDGFGIDLRFGAEGGSPYRDLMQLSAMLDRYCNCGRPLHITATGVPSAAPGVPQWTQRTQGQWLHDFYRVAFSKPLVETVTWQALADDPKSPVQVGLLAADMTAKQSFEEMLFLRSRVFTRDRAPEADEED